MALKGLYHVLHPPVPSRRIVHGRGIRGLIQPRLADTHSSHLACQFNSARANLATGPKYHSLLSFWMGTQTTSRDNMSSNIFDSVDQLSNNNKQTQSQKNVHISAEFGGRGRMGLQLSENNKRTLCLNSKSVARVRQRKQMAPPCPLHRQSVLSEPKLQLALVTTYTRPNIHLQSSSEIICKVHPHTSKI